MQTAKGSEVWKNVGVVAFFFVITLFLTSLIPGLSYKANGATYPTGLAYILAMAAAVGVYFSVQRGNNLDKALANLNGFTVTQQHPPASNILRTSGMAVDEQTNQICFYQFRQGKLDARIFQGQDILEAEVVEDGYSVTKSSTSSVAGRAVLGGLLLGPAGAIVGGVTAKRRTDGKVKSIDLRVIVNDTAKPIHTINFMNIEQEKGSAIYKKAFADAKHWHAVINVLIRRGS
jgi:hypothetical protein